MTAATARHADARLAPSPAKVATCLHGEVPRDASESPTRPEPLGTATGDASSSPASPDTPDASPRARGVPCGASGASAALVDVERPLLPGEARATRSTSSRATENRERKPSLPRAHWVPDKDAKACGNAPCSRPFTVLLRRHHCRACGLVFCRQCVDARLLLDPETAEPVKRKNKNAVAARVCVDCYERAFEAAKNMKENETRRRVVSRLPEKDEEAREFRNAEEASEESSPYEGCPVPGASPRMSVQSEIQSSSAASEASELSSARSVSAKDFYDDEDSSSRESARSGRSVTLRRNPPTAFLSARTRIEMLAEDPEGYERSVGAATPARDASSSSSKDASFDADDDAFASREPFSSPRLNAHTPLASPLETAEGRRVRRETAALLEAVTPALRAGVEETPERREEPFSSDGVSHRSPANGVFSANDAPSSSPRRLVARFARQLREQARLTEDAAAAAREAQRRAAATEEELALARAQVRRMGALWEELTNARRELESARGTHGCGAEKQSQWSARLSASFGSGSSSSLLATFETKFVNSGDATRTDSNRGKWSECVVWHSATPPFAGLSFQDCDSGVTRRVRHRDVAAVRAAFDAATGSSVLAVTVKEDTDAFVALGSCVRCRVDGPVTANRWALEIQKHLDANTRT